MILSGKKITFDMYIFASEMKMGKFVSFPCVSLSSCNERRKNSPGYTTEYLFAVINLQDLFGRLYNSIRKFFHFFLHLNTLQKRNSLAQKTMSTVHFKIVNTYINKRKTNNTRVNSHGKKTE